MTPGRKMQFTYPNYSGAGIEGECEQGYARHSGQIVEIIEELPEAFSDADGNSCRGYRVRADDGWCGVVWPGELRDTQHPRTDKHRAEPDRPYAVIDEEAKPNPRVLTRCSTEAAAVAWIDNQPDRAKVERGGYGIDGPGS